MLLNIVLFLLLVATGRSYWKISNVPTSYAKRAKVQGVTRIPPVCPRSAAALPAVHLIFGCLLESHQ